ncbi:MAG: adenylate cyclase [Patescibacteria group bacterium]
MTQKMENLEVILNKEMSKEIERKFLIKVLPKNLKEYPHEKIAQGYLSMSKEDGNMEIRLRKKGKKYYLTAKGKGGKIKTELEAEITESQFNTFWIGTEGKRIEKTRYKIPFEKVMIELDIYEGALEGFCYADIEFLDEKSCDEFIAPEWFAEEATDDRRYSNKTLILKGLPEEYIKPESR